MEWSEDHVYRYRRKIPEGIEGLSERKASLPFSWFQEGRGHRKDALPSVLVAHLLPPRQGTVMGLQLAELADDPLTVIRFHVYSWQSIILVLNIARLRNVVDARAIESHSNVFRYSFGEQVLPA